MGPTFAKKKLLIKRGTYPRFLLMAGQVNSLSGSACGYTLCPLLVGFKSTYLPRYPRVLT